MLDIIFTVIAIVLFAKAIALALKLTWGAAKIGALILLVLAAPLFIVCLLIMGGFLLLIPVGLIAGAIALMKALA